MTLRTLLLTLQTALPHEGARQSAMSVIDKRTKSVTKTKQTTHVQQRVLRGDLTCGPLHDLWVPLHRAPRAPHDNRCAVRRAVQEQGHVVLVLGVACG